MPVTIAGPTPSRGPAAGQRFGALVWALLHAPLFLALFAPGIGGAIRSAPEAYRAALWPTFLPQATLLSLVAFVLALPFSPSPKAYRFAAPAVAALVTAGLALDARIYQSVGFHLNGFFLRFLLQPNALTEAGVPKSDVAIFLAFAAAFAAVDVALGAWFIRRLAAPARANGSFCARSPKSRTQSVFQRTGGWSGSTVEAAKNEGPPKKVSPVP